MSDHWEIISDYKPLGRPMHPATKAEKREMLQELRVFGSTSREELLDVLVKILGRPLLSLDSLYSSEARRVIEHCQRAKRRRGAGLSVQHP
ncbi:hypothetical protein NCCP1664_21000 [Zafaria cholistanensis]|uniref:Uncharacterized protein n=1 Tax=Zafaria cholistanensis TaxID=1682741 RepID=A0A5A7NS02_9MICC|nr:hypothetical protein [Zafaria cholistanensis]GER23605.1 hypothetical protein NCCP1664_21000 [Zafaria cholistanensis]